MAFLHENNYSAITPDEVPGCFAAKEGKGKFVAITFDDGFRDFYENAYPVLRKYKFAATVFLPAAFIDDGGKKLKGRECLKWHEIAELRRGGIYFGSHTMTHPQLKHLTRREIEYEVRASKEAIEERIGERVRMFSYPYAFPEENREFILYLKKLLAGSGYCCGVTTRIGMVTGRDERYFLKRIPMNSFDDPPFFRTKLEGGYNWLYGVQYCLKRIRNRKH